VQSKDQLLREVSQIKQTAYLTMLGFVLLSLLFANKLTTVLLRPLYKLQTLMRRVEDNDLSVRFESKFQDEVAQVGSRFNRMLDEITRLIEDVRKGETEKRRSEMKALTAQMNPHFFYNTLNTIYCKSVLGENEDASAMILALSEMFQLSLNAGKELIPLQDELRHAEQYVAIQQISYENLFLYASEVEEEQLLQCLVPKIILQPLVENSILHGFRNRRSGGEIRVTVKSGDGILRLTVEDNGEGIPSAKATDSPSVENRPRSRHGYALPNITHRLQLYFGNEAGMAMTSRPGEGTSVEIWLPIVEEEHKDER
jgi:two-component system sensor histidine kinase YesM